MSRLTGLIPAHAGKTSPLASSASRWWAHPRSRGENGTALTAAINPTGSSPLTRGKPACTIRRVQCIGLIPAHAGKTPWIELDPAAPAAHPRSRGENQFCIDSMNRNGGSSPLTRGKQPLTGGGVLACRLIPAHAGKTASHE